MEISVTHVKQKDLPDYVFPGGIRPLADLSQKPPVMQPLAAANAASASVAGAEVAAQEANANLAEAMQEGTDKAVLKRSRAEEAADHDTKSSGLPSPGKKARSSLQGAAVAHRKENKMRTEGYNRLQVMVDLTKHEQSNLFLRGSALAWPNGVQMVSLQSGLQPISD